MMNTRPDEIGLVVPHKKRRCRGATYPESCITKYTTHTITKYTTYTKKVNAFVSGESSSAGLHASSEALEGRCKATWKREFKLPWCEAGPPNYHDDTVGSDQ